MQSGTKALDSFSVSSYFLSYIKQLSRYFNASLIPMLLNLAINPLVSLNMSPEDFAITGYFTSFGTLISPIIAFYMIHYYNKRYFELDEEGREHLRAVLFKSLIFFSFAVAVLCLLALLFYVKSVSVTTFPAFPYLYMAVMTIPFTGIYNLELADYKMKRESKAYMNLSLARGVLGVACTVLFVVIIKWGAFGKLLGPMLIEIAVFIFLLYKHRDVWQIKTETRELLPILKFCWPLALGAALGYFSNGYDKTVLESLGNVTEFGYYCVGTSIAAYLGVFTTSISATFQPDTYEAIIKDNKRKLIKVVGVRWGLTLIVVTAFILFCPFVIKILTAGKYMASVPYARIFALVSLTNSIYYIINDYSIAKGKPQYYLITTILGSLSIMYCMPLFVEKWSYSGGAVMNVLSFIILSFINILLLCIPSQKTR